MTASLAGFFNPAFTTDTGAPAAGFRLYTYASGTTTQKTVYTSAAGDTPHTYTSDGLGGQYIALNARGELPAAIWLSSGVTDIVLKTNLGATVWTKKAVGLDNGALTLESDLSSPDSDKGAAKVSYTDLGTGAAARTVQTRLRDFPPSANSFASLSAAAAGCTTLYVPAGTWVVSADTTISIPMELAPGAILSPNILVTLTINGPFSAPVQQCFSGAGTVVISRASTPIAYAEHWGAVADGTATGNEVPINKALAAHGSVQLLSGTYLQSGPIVVQGDGKRLMGAGNSATVLQTSSATIDHIQVGGGADVAQFPLVCGITTNRTVNPAEPSGAARTAGAGIRFTKVNRGVVKDCTIYNSNIGVYIHDTGACRFSNVLALRLLGGGANTGYGFYIEGEIAGTLGFTGTANASLVMQWCQAGFSTALATTYGFYGKSRLSDLFLERPETGGASYGIWLEGDGSGITTGVDIQITQPIIDGIRTKGIYLYNFGSYGCVSIVGGYTSVAPGATHAIDIFQCTGVSVTGGHQFINALGATTEIGLSIRTSNQVVCTGNQFKGSTFPVAMTAGFMCSVGNNSMMLRSGQASIPFWISVTGGSNNSFLGNVMWSDAAAAKVTTGVVIDNTAASCMVDVTGMRAVNVVDKLKINAATISAVGASGTHFITGSFS
jgi:parallel beta-helix repeat protein